VRRQHPDSGDPERARVAANGRNRSRDRADAGDRSRPHAVGCCACLQPGCVDRRQPRGDPPARLRRFRRQLEIVVVSDGSIDENDRNLGKAYAVKLGALKAIREWIGFVDADLDPADLVRYVRRARERRLDLAAGSKRHPDSHVIAALAPDVRGRTYRSGFRRQCNSRVSAHVDLDAACVVGPPVVPPNVCQHERLRAERA
jgi:hypothetical protein